MSHSMLLRGEVGGLAYFAATAQGKPLLLVANELSGTLTVWCVEPVDP